MDPTEEEETPKTQSEMFEEMNNASLNGHLADDEEEEKEAEEEEK